MVESLTSLQTAHLLHPCAALKCSESFKTSHFQLMKTPSLHLARIYLHQFETSEGMEIVSLTLVLTISTVQECVVFLQNYSLFGQVLALIVLFVTGKTQTSIVSSF